MVVEPTLLEALTLQEQLILAGLFVVAAIGIAMMSAGAYLIWHAIKLWRQQREQGADRTL